VAEIAAPVIPAPAVVQPDGLFAQQTAHGQVWRHIKELVVEPNVSRRTFTPKLKWGGYREGNTKRPVDYFMLLFPVTEWKAAVGRMNEIIRAPMSGLVNYADSLRWLGITLALALEPIRGPVQKRWQPLGRHVRPNPCENYGERFKMT
jgi:hypothetical protein